MTPDRPVWQEFDPSTFTFISRNDVAVNWVNNYRQENKFPEIKKVLLLGSGLVEPFTIAALLPRAEITAVDINEKIIGLAGDIKNGQKISWAKVGEVSLNPGLANTDFSEKQRLERSLSVLNNLGSFDRLGKGFDMDGIKVSAGVANRVNLVHSDALSALKSLTAHRFDLIGDFFLRVNINKHEKGADYTQNMMRGSFGLLYPTGMLLIGDTGKNLPITSHQFRLCINDGRLNLSSLVHAVNFGSGVATSHYLLASKIDRLFNNSKAVEIGEKLKENEMLMALSPVKTVILEVEDKINFALGVHKVNLAYIDCGSGKIKYSWDSKEGIAEALKKIVPNPWDEASKTVIFDAQKPYL